MSYSISFHFNSSFYQVVKPHYRRWRGLVLIVDSSSFQALLFFFPATQVDMGAWESCEEMPAVSLACEDQVGKVVLASLNTDNIISYLNNWFLIKTLQPSFKLFILSAAGHGDISWLKEDPKMPQDKCCFLLWHTQHWLPFPQGQADFVSLFFGDIYIYLYGFCSRQEITSLSLFVDSIYSPVENDVVIQRNE